MNPNGNFILELIAGLTFAYFLIIFLVTTIVISSIVIMTNGEIKNLSFDVPIEYKNAINELNAFFSNLYDDFCISEFEIMYYSEHKKMKNGKGRTRQIHQKGIERKKTDKFGGEKGDRFRNFRRHSKTHLWWLLWKIFTREQNENEE